MDARSKSIQLDQIQSKQREARRRVEKEIDVACNADSAADYNNSLARLFKAARDYEVWKNLADTLNNLYFGKEV